MKKSWFTVSQVHKNIYALAEFSHWEKVVSYLILDKTKAFLIDTGMGYQSIKNEVNKITPLPVEVLLTHAHWDHIGGVDEFEVVSIFNDSFEKKNLKKGFQSKQIPELSDPQLFENGYQPTIYAVFGTRKFQTFTNADIFHSDSFDIEVMHTPGHTPGSVCFSIPKLNVVLTGDVLYPGPLYAQLPESNINDYSCSLTRLRKCSAPTVLILPGHNAVSAQSSLLDEAIQLFTELKHSIKNTSGQEIKGQFVSIML